MTSSENLQDVDAYVYFGYDNNAEGVVGTAFIGTSCHSDQSYRSSITEWFQSDLRTAEVNYIYLEEKINFIRRLLFSDFSS